MAESVEESDPQKRRIRRIAAVAFAILAVVLATMAVDAFWPHNRIFDTDHFVESPALLPQDPAGAEPIATMTVEA